MVPRSNSYEGDKHIEATSRGLFVGGDGNTQGGFNVGRVAFFDFNSVAAQNGAQTEITDPIEGRIEPTDEQFEVTGTATAAGGIQRVELEIMDRNNNRYLSDDLTTWGTTAFNTFNATLDTRHGPVDALALPLTISGNRELIVRARAVAVNNTADNDQGDQEDRDLQHRPTSHRTRSVNGPGSLLNSLDLHDHRVGDRRLRRQLGQLDPAGRPGPLPAGRRHRRRAPTTPSGSPRTCRARLSTTWSLGDHRAVPRASGRRRPGPPTPRASPTWTPRTAGGSWLENGQAPTVSISQPVSMVPPMAVPQPVVVAPGSPITFSGTASDDEQLNIVEIALRNNTTGESLAADGTLGHERDRWLLPGLADRPRTAKLQLELHDAVQPLTRAATASRSGDTTRSDWARLGRNEGRLTINAQIPGDATTRWTAERDRHGAPAARCCTWTWPGTATDDHGVAQVRVALEEDDTSRYLQPDGSLAAAFATLPRDAGHARSDQHDLDAAGRPADPGRLERHGVRLRHCGPAGHVDLGATARYPIYPGDQPPVLDRGSAGCRRRARCSPTGKIFVSGRAEDDQGRCSEVGGWRSSTRRAST